MKGERDDIDVILKYSTARARSLKDIETILVKNKYGYPIPITNVSVFLKKTSIPIIKREDQQRYISVGAGVIDNKDRENNANAINKRLQKWIEEDLSKKYPEVRFLVGGELEDQRKLMKSTGIALLLSVFLIFLILTAMFKSYSQPFVVMLAIPFAIIGAIFGVAVIGNTPLGLLPFLGMVALTGIVVNDSLVMVSFINKLRVGGKNSFEAVIEGAVRRFRPIILTTLTTVVGVVPLAFGNLWVIQAINWVINGIIGIFLLPFGLRLSNEFKTDPFLEPMALSIFWGLFFGSMMILVIIPCLYLVIEKLISFIFKLFGKTYEAKHVSVG